MSEKHLARASRVICRAAAGRDGCLCHNNAERDPAQYADRYCQAFTEPALAVLRAFSISPGDAHILAAGTHVIRKRPVRKAKAPQP